MQRKLFVGEVPEDYTLTEITWERWTSQFANEANIKQGISKSTMLRRAGATMSRFLDKSRDDTERTAVYDYMTGKIGEVDLINSLKMTKLQKVYLWPILPNITGYIAGNISDKELQSICYKFYSKVLL